MQAPCSQPNHGIEGLSECNELEGTICRGLAAWRAEAMKAVNIAHIARSYILEIYMYFKHSELKGISGKPKKIWLCRVTAPWLSHLVKSFG
jgi:hypothetical protein